MAEGMQVNVENSDDGCIRSKLLKLLECPVCYETIYISEMCINGHTVCSRCHKHLNCCPLCNQRFGNVRNLLGEGVAELLSYKLCCNISRGCNEFLAKKECKKHEAVCPFRLYSCKECNEQLCFMELKDHFQRRHKRGVLRPCTTKVLQLDEAIEGRVYFCLIEFNEELFWFWRKHSEADVYFGVRYCGYSENISAYKYNIQLISKSQKADMEFSAPVLPDVREFDQYALIQDYVVLSKNFMGEGARFQVSINKAREALY